MDSPGYNVVSASLSLVVSPTPSVTNVVANTHSLESEQRLSLAVRASGDTGGYSYTWTSVPAACLANAAVLTCVFRPPRSAATLRP